MSSNTPFRKADFLIPGDVDLSKWSVIACDQHTSDQPYWDRVRESVGDTPSTLNLIIPESELDESTLDERASEIRKKYNEYLNRDNLTEYKDSYIYVERRLNSGKIRCGILGVVDLEEYEAARYAETLIRPSEQTVFERVPPRVKIREGCAGETSHLVMFIDDEKKEVIEPLATKKQGYQKIYDFDLQENGGHLTGWLISKEDAEEIDRKLSAMADKDYVSRKYGTDSEAAPLLMLVGDGNHSLCAAKDAYDKLKSKLRDEALNHPSRYYMAELENLHSDAFEFEPIYRVVTDVNTEQFLDELKKETSESGNGQKVTYYYAGGKGEAVFEDPSFNITVGTLQRFIDNYIEDFGEGKCDYIHGEEELKALCEKEGTVGFVFDGIGKDGLFKSVIEGGTLPRKTFSIGTAEDKRYYLEMRRINVPVKLITERDADVQAVVAYDRDIFCDFNLFHINKRERKGIKNIITSVLVFGIGVYLLITRLLGMMGDNGIAFDFVQILFPSILTIGGAVWIPLSNKLTKKSLAMNWDSQTQLHSLVNIIRVSDEGVYVFSDNNNEQQENFFEFDRFQKIYETEKAFYAYYGVYNAVMITKEDIEIGTVEKLREIFAKNAGKKFSSKYVKPEKNN